MLIGLCGLIGSGKGTVAEYLMEEHYFLGASFAEKLKDACACIFGWDRDMLEGDTPESRAWREVVDPWWAERLGIPHFSPRFALQHVGTEIMRGTLHPDIWVLATERMINYHLSLDWHTGIVIADVRFPNEVAMIRRLGGQVWHIQRGKLPDWFGKKHPAGIHESEYAWNNETFDLTIHNDETMGSLYKTVDTILQK
jgi:hypothetical protein